MDLNTKKRPNAMAVSIKNQFTIAFAQETSKEELAGQ